MGKRGGPGSGWSLAALGDGLLRREMRLESPKPGSGNPHFLDNKNVDLCCYNQSFQRQNPCNVIALTLKIQRQRQTDLFRQITDFVILSIFGWQQFWLSSKLGNLPFPRIPIRDRSATQKIKFQNLCWLATFTFTFLLLLFCPPPRRESCWLATFYWEWI